MKHTKGAPYARHSSKSWMIVLRLFSHVAFGERPTHFMFHSERDLFSHVSFGKGFTYLHRPKSWMIVLHLFSYVSFGKRPTHFAYDDSEFHTSDHLETYLLEHGLYSALSQTSRFCQRLSDFLANNLPLSRTIGLCCKLFELVTHYLSLSPTVWLCHKLTDFCMEISDFATNNLTLSRTIWLWHKLFDFVTKYLTLSAESVWIRHKLTDFVTNYWLGHEPQIHGARTYRKKHKTDPWKDWSQCLSRTPCGARTWWARMAVASVAALVVVQQSYPIVQPLGHTNIFCFLFGARRGGKVVGFRLEQFGNWQILCRFDCW